MYVDDSTSINMFAFSTDNVLGLLDDFPVNSSKWCYAHFCQFPKKSIFLSPSRACLNTLKKRVVLLNNVLPFLNLFFCPSCDRYCTIQLADRRWLFKDWERHKWGKLPMFSLVFLAFLHHRRKRPVAPSDWLHHFWAVTWDLASLILFL